MKKFKKAVAAIANYSEDILILCGLAFIAAATFLLSLIAGLYVTGAILFGMGVWFTVHHGEN